MINTNVDLLRLSHKDLLNIIPKDRVVLVQNFLHELNRREYEVRFKQSCTFNSFEYKKEHKEEFGYGFNVDGNAVPYFHPNRSFHDEIIWLNDKVFYNEKCTFEDKLINACVVKFYGPSGTIDILTRDTGEGYLQYDKLIHDDNYMGLCMENVQKATSNGEKIYGTTELRTSLQTESRNYTRAILTPYDKLLETTNDINRKGRGSDMIFWFRELGPKLVDFYSGKPTMEESFNFLTSFRGIGNYYGYHLSTNLARMPEIGTHHLLRKGTPFGLLDEDDEFVAPGVGAMITINWLYEHLGFSINTKVGAKIIRAIRADQDNFFGFKGESKFIVEQVFETGYLTTFGCEISCCQFGVFTRLRDNEKLARKRSKAPIGKEGTNDKPKLIVMNKNKEDVEGGVRYVTFAELKDITPVEPKKESNVIILKDEVLATIVEEKLEVIIPTTKPIVKLKPKAQPKVPIEANHNIILELIEELGVDEFSHGKISTLLALRGNLGLNQSSNWKESWMILQYMVSQGSLFKEGTKYIKNY